MQENRKNIMHNLNGPLMYSKRITFGFRKEYPIVNECKINNNYTICVKQYAGGNNGYIK